MVKVYNWVVVQMDTKPQEGNLTDVVVMVHWRRQVHVTDGDKTYFAEKFDMMPCASPSEIDFTAYPDLTFEQVCGWLEAGLDVVAIDAYLDDQIEQQINPPIIVLPNPWVPIPPVPTTTSTTTEEPSTTTTTTVAPE